jgi:hypothetical protein
LLGGLSTIFASADPAHQAHADAVGCGYWKPDFHSE